MLEVDGQTVRVMKMGIRATLARTLDDEEIIIPNSLLAQNPVKNFTLADSLYRLRAKVGVVYGADLRRVFEVLREAAGGLAWKTATREPTVLLTDFGDSAVNFEVSVWIDNPWRMRRFRSELNEAIWWALKQAQITIAFPQLDVHLDPAERPAGGGGAADRLSRAG